MSTKYVKFANEQDAEDYSDFLDAGLALVSPALVPWAWRNEETGKLRQDVNGKWVVAWYGPPFVFGGVEVEPLEGDEEARAAGELSDTPDWPEEDEG